MEFVTFKKFIALVPEAGLRNKTLKEQSIIICGDPHLYSIISKVNNGYDIGYGGDNYRTINSFMNKFGYSLELIAPKDVEDSVKDRKIKELESRLAYYETREVILSKKDKAYRLFEEVLRLFNEATKEERLCKRPRHNRKRDDR
jgi:hypothetical protein